MGLQTITGSHISGAGVPVSGRGVKATPLPGQFTGATIDVQPVEASTTTDGEGNWSLELVQGVTYDVRIERWGLATIRVTAEAEKDFVAYLGGNAALGGTVPGSVKCETGESIVPFIYQNTDGEYVISWRVVA